MKRAEPRWCRDRTRRSRPVGDIVPEPPRRHAQLRRGCWVPASRAVRSSASAREICPAHARPRAPARAGGAPSRPRHALARRERRCGARTDAREQPSPSQQLAPSEHRSRRIRRDPRDPRVGPRGAAAPHATPAESAGATERLLRPPGRVIIGPLDGAAEHGPRRPMDQDDDPRREAALREARRAAAGRSSRQSLAIHRRFRKPGGNTRANCFALAVQNVRARRAGAAGRAPRSASQNGRRRVDRRCLQHRVIHQEGPDPPGSKPTHRFANASP